MIVAVQRFFSRCDAIELRYCVLLNRTSQFSFVRFLFVIVSRLGDGILWYTLIATLPVLYGVNGVWMSLQVLITGFICLLVYKLLKKMLIRERPCISFSGIRRAAPALDRYSFPSGHTMHAVTFAMMLSAYLPQVVVLIWSFAGLIAISRVVLGLHYPSDVFAGALLGYAIGRFGLLLGSEITWLGWQVPFIFQ